VQVNLLTINIEFGPGWDMDGSAIHERSGPGHDLMAVDRARRAPHLRRDVGAEQRPRRIPHNLFPRYKWPIRRSHRQLFANAAIAASRVAA